MCAFPNKLGVFLHWKSWYFIKKVDGPGQQYIIQSVECSIRPKTITTIIHMILMMMIVMIIFIRMKIGHMAHPALLVQSSGQHSDAAPRLL